MKIVPILMFVALVAVAIAHARWAMGRYWPATDARQLSIYVVGDPTAKVKLTLPEAQQNVAAAVVRIK